MSADLSLAISTARRLARMYRVIDDVDLQQALTHPMPFHLRLQALSSLAGQRVLFRRKSSRNGFNSAIYEGDVLVPHSTTPVASGTV